MRISGANGLPMAVPAAAPRRAGTATFTPSEAETPRQGAAAAGLRTIGGIDALIALQGVDALADPVERRKHAVKRGRLALDALDELKIGLLGGVLSAATLTKLKSAAGYLKDGSGEPGLDSVLAEIELRVEVEIAKMDSR
jgi:Class II flagellar assembly regulator